ncbi:hypothetical protein PTKIN_Ptkin14bG0037100 [Pterospermum kingtungense]
MALSAYIEAIKTAAFLAGTVIVCYPLSAIAAKRIVKEVDELDDAINALRKQPCLKCPDCQGQGCRNNIEFEAKKNSV